MSIKEENTVRRQANGAFLNKHLRNIPGVCVTQEDPRITRRAYHLYTVRVDAQTMGLSRDRFVKALTAEGVPVSSGYLRPLYKNAVFQNLRSMRANPGLALDYKSVSCPACERACDETVWLFHTLLLADESAMRDIVNAIEKVVERASEAPA
jgi:dTDP-4-amino-4,6-dideoxygalactose transaminase